MGIEAYITLAVVIGMMAALVKDWAPTDLTFFGGLSVLLLTGIVTPQEAFAGFSNPGLVVIALLFIVSAAVQNTGALNNLVHGILGTSKSSTPVLLMRMMAPVSALSMFVSNTPIVIILVPIIRKWTEKMGLSASRFFIPLSYAAILGGMCTLIGTSTNLVVHGLLLENGMRGLSMFELAGVGLPITVIGWLYLAFIGHRMLPERKNMQATVSEHKKEYVVEMKVRQGCELIGKTVAQAGLRNLRGLFLLDIERGGNSLGPISSNEVIQSEDRLIFVGLTEAVVDLQDIPGLVPAAHDMFEKDFAAMRTHLVEAVISSGSPILGKTVKDCNFRARYGAGVVAVHRNGERVLQKIGDIVLREGDTLLLFAPDYFTRKWKDSQDFYLISSIKEKAPVAWQKSTWTLVVVTGMVLLATLGSYLPLVGGQKPGIVHAVFIAALLLVLTRCIRATEARKSIRWDILITIGCAFGISRGMLNSGAADAFAGLIVHFSDGMGPAISLALVYLLAMLFTEVMTNNAAAAMVFPVAMSVSQQSGHDPRPYFIALTIAASASFLTPIGYQTNLIVQGAGGYKFKDYFRIGLPLAVLTFVISMAVIPVLWPL